MTGLKKQHSRCILYATLASVGNTSSKRVNKERKNLLTMKNFLNFIKERKMWIIEMTVVFAVFAFFLLIFIRNTNSLQPYYDNIFRRIFAYVGLIAGILPTFYMLYQAILVSFYKPFTRWPEGRELPRCTVIVPAYNEGEHVASTIESLLASDYPMDKLEILAINDGSKDDTWNWIKFAAEKSNGVVKAINFTENRGKKQVLHYGFSHAKGEILVTIDSDSSVYSNTIRNLVLPFANPQIVASAGVVRVKNIKDGFIPKILDICFVFSADFIRSAQSVVGGVLCPPGAVSAYRKSALYPHLDEWLNQTFMGKPSNIGEDRALTSILLRDNNMVVLQRNAVALTNVPTTYNYLCRTLLRWTRSEVREDIRMLKIFFKKLDPTNLRLAALRVNIISNIVGVFVPALLIPNLLYNLITSYDNFIFILSQMVVFAWVWASIPAVLYAQHESPLRALWSFFYAVFSLFALSWICVYSWLTMDNAKWMTREKHSPAAEPETEKENSITMGDRIS